MENNDIQYRGITISESDRQPCEVYTRVVGYIRPVSRFNKAKKQEFKDRKTFKETN